MLKRAVLESKNVGISLKKRRFLKLILIVVDIKNSYYADYQCLLYNAKNKRFSVSKDNVLANIGCIYGQNRHFVEFIHIYRRGVIYHVPLPAQGLIS